MKAFKILFIVIILLAIVMIPKNRQQAEPVAESSIEDPTMPRSRNVFCMETGDAEYLDLVERARPKMASTEMSILTAEPEAIGLNGVEPEEKTEYTAPAETEIPTEPTPAAGEIPGEVELMACVVWTEAGNQDMTGKRLIVSTILNRVETAGFPDTVIGVITQPSQYVYGSYYTQECIDAVLAELNERTDYNVLWFWATGYPPYGTPLFQHGGHYFSGKPL